MASFTDSFDIPANATVKDVLQGTRIENVPKQAQVYGIEVYATSSATGIKHELFVDSQNAIERSLVSAANRVPEVDKDGVLGAFVRGGSRLQLNVTNTTGTSQTYFLKLSLDAA